MGILDFFRSKNTNSAKQAKERLQIIVAHQRDGRNTAHGLQPEFMEDMKREILEVVRKYIDIEPEDVNTDLTREGQMEVLGLTINLAEKRRNKIDNTNNIEQQTPEPKSDDEQTPQSLSK